MSKKAECHFRGRGERKRNACSDYGKINNKRQTQQRRNGKSIFMSSE